MSDWFYRFGRALLSQSARLYYRRIEVLGGERIPATGAAIIVANHPNSVADAFLLASQLSPRKLNFIAKDSITRAPLVGWLVRRLGVVGVARGMDYERRRDLARQRNQAALGTCVPRLMAGELIAIFGEGVSDDARHLHMIRKGAMRFGYAAERGAEFKLGLVWVPVGITYSAKQRFRSDVLIRVGEPFRLAELGVDPATPEQRVFQSGTERLQRELESLVVNIEREELAGLIDRLADLLGHPPRSLATRIETHQRVARAVQYFNLARPQRVAELESALRRYRRALSVAGLTDEVVRQRHAALTLAVSLRGLLRNGALMVLNLYGWANSLVPRWAARLIGPLGRTTVVAPDGSRAVEVTKEALWGTLAAWAAAALAFPVQTYLVYQWAAGAYGGERGAALAALYALSLIPSWRLFTRRRDILRQHYTGVRDALRFLLKAGPATRLQGQRRRLQRRIRALLAGYDAEAPRTA